MYSFLTWLYDALMHRAFDACPSLDPESTRPSVQWAPSLGRSLPPLFLATAYPRGEGSYVAPPTFRETWNAVRTSAVNRVPTGWTPLRLVNSSRMGRSMWPSPCVSCCTDPHLLECKYIYVIGTDRRSTRLHNFPRCRSPYSEERSGIRYAVRIGLPLSSRTVSCCRRGQRGPRQSPPECFWEVYVHVSRAGELLCCGFSLYVRHPHSLLCPHWLKRRFTRSQPSLFVPTCSCHVCE